MQLLVSATEKNCSIFPIHLPDHLQNNTNGFKCQLETHLFTEAL